MDVKHAAAEGNANQTLMEWEKNIIRLKTGGDIYNGLKYAHEKVSSLESSLVELKKQNVGPNQQNMLPHAHAISLLQEDLTKTKNQLATLVRRKWLSEEDYLSTLESCKTNHE